MTKKVIFGNDYGYPIDNDTKEIIIIFYIQKLTYQNIDILY